MFSQAFHFVTRHINRFSPQDWLLILLGVALWGLFCMRSFGSRSGQ
jgi:hypothetical protein